MKVIVNDNQVPKERPFPKLMIQPSTGSIILATSIDNNRPWGTLLKTTQNGYSIGETTDWASNFVDFEGPVTLSND